MAKDKTLQKVFYFSSEKNKAIIEGLLSDEADVTNLPMTKHLEKYLLDSILTTNKTASDWISRLYITNGVTPNEIFRGIMSDIFSYYASFKSPEDTNGRMFAEYAKQMNDKSRFLKPEIYDKGTVPYFWTLVQQYKKCLEHKLTKMKDMSAEIFNLENDVEVMALILEEKGNSGPKDITTTFTMLYQIILKNWDDMENKSEVYLLLSHMSRMQTWDGSAETRVMLSNVIRSSINGCIC